jgi:2-amino-4-hydroxy-6-hydroxymethyldihydropteridine diphosphokinase
LPEDIVLLLGSNMGDSIRLIEKAGEMVREKVGEVSKKSKLYKTAPWGKTDQEWFLNQAILVSANSSPEEILPLIQSIEKEIGRERKEKWGARLIDIDMLAAGPKILTLPELTLPHLYLHLRRFSLIPLRDVWPDWVHPILHQDVDEMLANCPDKGEVVPV